MFMTAKLVPVVWEIYYWYTFIKELEKYPGWHRRALVRDMFWKDISVNLKRMMRWELKWPIHHSTTHGMHKTRFYNLYQWIVKRCTNPKFEHYHRYGWRWIQCEWKSFDEFKDDMYESYLNTRDELTTIDRIDNDKNYCKDNCRWASRLVQANNRSTWIDIPDKYKWKTLNDLCLENKITRNVFYWRKNRWWSFEECLHWNK